MTTQTVLIAVFVLLALPILWSLIRFVTWLLSLRVGGYGNIETAVGDTTEKITCEHVSVWRGENDWSLIGKRIQANLDVNPDFYLTDGQQ